MGIIKVLRVCTFVVGVGGCGGKEPGGSEGSTGTASSGGASMSETGAPTSGGSDSGGVTGTGAGSSGAGSTSGEDSGTTGAAVCSLEHEACALAGSLGEFMDCGSVDPWNDAALAWQAAHDCALAAASGQRPFKLITILQGIDSDVGAAYVGVAARSYALSELFFDGDPCGGGGCGPVVSAASCAGLVATMDCVVAPGEVCLSCEGQGTLGQVCGPA